MIIMYLRAIDTAKDFWKRVGMGVAFFKFVKSGGEEKTGMFWICSVFRGCGFLGYSFTAWRRLLLAEYACRL